MPKAVDKHPQQRGLGRALYNPNRSGVASFEDPLSAIDDEATRSGQWIREAMEGIAGAFDGFVDWMKSGFGLDFSSVEALLDQLFNHPKARLRADRLTGYLPESMIGQIPFTAITDFSPNLLVNAQLETESAMEELDGWDWDPDVRHSGIGGSASVLADGTVKAMRSYPITPVSPGKTVAGEGWVRWRGVDLSSAGPAFLLIVEKYDENDQRTGSVTLESFSNPTANSSNIGHEDFILLDGQYNVPDDGTRGVTMRIEQTARVIAGRSWWHDFALTVVDTPLNKRLQNIDLDGWFDLTKTFNQLPNFRVGGIDTAPTLQDALAAILDVFSQGLGNLPDFNNGFSEMLAVATGARRELTELAAGVAQLQTDKAGNNNSGVSHMIEVSQFVGIPTGLNKFHDSGAGVVTNDGDTLEFSNDNGRELFIFDQPLQTTYPEVSLVVPRQAGRYFGGYGGRALYWIFRANDPLNPTTYTFARLNGNSLRFGCVRAGVNTILNPDWFAPAQRIYPSSYMTARAGTLAGGARQFQFLVNNTPRATITDAAAVSIIDETTVYFGAGIQNEANDLINRAPNISHIFANDNVPTPVQGVTFRAYRANNAAAGLSAATGYPLPANVLDTVDYNSNPAEHFDWNPTTQTLTVKIEGTYLFTLRGYSADEPSFNREWQANIILNGVVIPGMSLWSASESDEGGNDQHQRSILANIPIYVPANATVRPSLRLEKTGNFGAVESGAVLGGGRTYFSAVLLNRSVT